MYNRTSAFTTSPRKLFNGPNIRHRRITFNGNFNLLIYNLTVLLRGTRFVSAPYKTKQNSAGGEAYLSRSVPGRLPVSQDVGGRRPAVDVQTFPGRRTRPRRRAAHVRGRRWPGDARRQWLVGRQGTRTAILETTGRLCEPGWVHDLYWDTWLDLIGPCLEPETGPNLNIHYRISSLLLRKTSNRIYVFVR